MQQLWRRGCHKFPGSMPIPQPLLQGNPTPDHREFTPIVPGHRGSGWWEFNWCPDQSGRLFMGLHSPKAPGRPYTSQHKRTVLDGVRSGDSPLICSLQDMLLVVNDVTD